MALSDSVFRFGAFELLPARRELRCRGVPVALGTRAFDLLAALVRREGALATKDELLVEVWAGTVVDENNLAAQVSALRKILAADPDLSRRLVTVPGRGYRFVAEISVVAPSSTDAIAALDAAPDGAPSLVVLPFASLGADPAQAHFAAGLSQIVATDLSRIAGLVVVASASAATFGPAPADVRAVSRTLGVGYVLAGSVQRGERAVRINAQLIDGQSGAQVWSEILDGDDADLLSLQDRITGRIANAIGREIFVAAARSSVARHADPRATDLVIRGIAADTRPQSRDVLREQEALFAQALALDPDHADALARLARAILLQVTQGHVAPDARSEALARGVAAAERAVGLDPRNARAHNALGLVHVLARDFERAALADETAIALDRNFALSHNNLGNALLHLGRGGDALRAVETALRLDPLGPQLGSFLTVAGFSRLLIGETDAAVAAFARARAANPLLPRAHAGAAIALANADATAAAERATDELLRVAPHFRLSDTIDASGAWSPPAYRRFHDEVLVPGARRAGVPL
jgi:TolB-like protein/Tfp pilus assembly protein PilF